MIRYPQKYSFTFQDGTVEEFTTDTNNPRRFTELILEHGEELDRAHEMQNEIISFTCAFTFHKKPQS